MTKKKGKAAKMKERRKCQNLFSARLDLTKVVINCTPIDLFPVLPANSSEKADRRRNIAFRILMNRKISYTSGTVLVQIAGTKTETKK